MTITNRNTSTAARRCPSIFVVLARVAGAALVAITFISIAPKTPFASRAGAQNAPGYRVDSRCADGLCITTFTTPLGVIKVNLPDDMAAGDTISGTVTPEATGQNDAERAQNLIELKRHVFVVEGQQTLVGAKTFSWTIPRPLNPNSKNISLLQRGQNVVTTTIPIAATPPPSPSGFTLPTGGQQGRLIQIKGPGNGIFSPQDYVKVGGTLLPPLAESPRSLIVRNASESVGPTNIDVHENGVGMQCPFRNIGINLSAPKLALIRGETTTLHVVVVGLGGVAGDQSLDLENTSPNVIRMTGGDRQHINIHPSELRPDGTYSMDRTLAGIMAGSFGVTATVTWTDACKPLNLVVRPVTQPTPNGNSTGQGPARDKLEQGRNLLAHFKFYAALAPLSEALKSYKSGGDMNGIGVTSDALGDLYLQEGQYETALGYFQSARQAFVANKEMLNASLLISKIGETYLLLDNIAGAKAVFVQFGSQTASPSATDIVQHKTFFAYARNKLGEGRADYLLGQHSAAEADFKDLLAASSPTARDQEATRFRVAAITNLGDVLFRKGDLSAARIRYHEAIELARREHRIDLEWAAKAGLGKTLWALSRVTPTTRFQTRPELRAAHASGQTPESAAKLQADAQNAYRDALGDIETVVEGSIRGHEARTTFLSTTNQVFEEAAAVNAEMALAAKINGPTGAIGSFLRFTAEGFRIAEQGRARSLLDVLADGHAEISAGVPPDLIKRRSENLANQQLIGAQLTGVSLAGEVPKQTSAELEAELERLAVEFESLENQIKAASPRLDSLVHTRALTLDEVQRRVLDDDTALLEYSFGEQSSYLWVITRQNAGLFKLPAGSIMDQLAMDFRAQLIPPRLQRRNIGVDVPTTDDQQRGLGLSTAAPATDTAAFSRASHALYKVALAPAASMIGNRRLVIVADGALNFVPFEALVTTDRGGDYGSLDYVVKTNRVSYAPSASVTAAVRDQKRAVGRNILLVADPVFSANDARVQTGSAATRADVTRGLGLDSAVKDVTGQATQSSGPPTLPRLAGTRIEAEQIGRLAERSGAQSDLRLDLSANEDDLKTRDIQGYRALHIATHGVLDATRPQFSGLVLSLVGNKSDDDGFLRTGEVFNLRLGAPLVMLSACESGLGKVKRGEGVIGLSRAFMYAGATTVGVTLWSVADKPTAALMTDFYQRLLGPNPSPSAAMREAQLAMISGKKYSAPFYWAPFVLVGEWK
ncbi:MAG: CHAT domain-containing tetratricopeptide repeat protein [Acidobacteriota bacterium]|nr:CHAT domain-containing tetratricopeptide repeat protein [Acidobacteriota bacterium]